MGNRLADLARRAKVAADLGDPLVITPDEHAFLRGQRPEDWVEACLDAYDEAGEIAPYPGPEIPVVVRP